MDIMTNSFIRISRYQSGHVFPEHRESFWQQILALSKSTFTEKLKKFRRAVWIHRRCRRTFVAEIDAILPWKFGVGWHMVHKRFFHSRKETWMAFYDTRSTATFRWHRSTLQQLWELWTVPTINRKFPWMELTHPMPLQVDYNLLPGRQLLRISRKSKISMTLSRAGRVSKKHSIRKERHLRTITDKFGITMNKPEFVNEIIYCYEYARYNIMYPETRRITETLEEFCEKHFIASTWVFAGLWLWFPSESAATGTTGQGT